MVVLAVILFLLNMTPQPVSAADQMPVSDAVPSASAQLDDEDIAGVVVTDEDIADERSVETHTATGGFLGYRLLHVGGTGGRAAPYEYLHSSGSGGLFLNHVAKDHKFSLDGSYINEKDYNADLLYDYQGNYRLHLRTESLFHNLDRVFLTDPFSLIVNVTPPSSTPYNTSAARDIDDYGLRVEQDLARFRYKLPNYPLHLNLGYWRMLREGTQQFRFADQTFEAASNTIFAGARPIDHETHEGSAGVDAHVGPVDFVYTFLIRQFRDNLTTPVDTFLTRSTPGQPQLIQHNEDPDSRFLSHTVKLHTSLDGGITGGASYSYGRRENRSRLFDSVGAGDAETTLQNFAGDFTYTPCGSFNLAVKYRRQEVEPNSPATVTTTYLSSSQASVRPSFETGKDLIIATLSFRPTGLLSLKGEYKGEYVRRELSQQGDETLDWHGLPTHSATHRGSFAVLSRPLKGLRLKALYSYTATESPAYGTSFAQRHEGQFLATYSKSGTWGLTANYRAVREENDDVTRLQIVTVTPLSLAPFTENQSRDRSSDNATASVWFSPIPALTLSGSYSLLRTAVTQGILFTVVAPATADGADYTTQAQVYGLDAVYRLNDRATLSLALQQIRSSSAFTVNPLAGADVAGITDVTRLKTLESSLAARADYRLFDGVSCALDYAYRDFDNKTSSLYEGTVHSIFASVTAKW